MMFCDMFINFIVALAHVAQLTPQTQILIWYNFYLFPGPFPFLWTRRLLSLLGPYNNCLWGWHLHKRSKCEIE